MIIPIKCFTCGKVLANKYQFYKKEVARRKNNAKEEQDEFIYLKAGENKKTIEGEVMDHLRLDRYCCRRHMLTHVDIF